MDERLIISGFGGQGILFVGKLWAELIMRQGHEVTFFPAYGAEVRGGTCNCAVIGSDEEIAMPVIDIASSLIMMNQQSLVRFAPKLAPGGLAVVNSSMVDHAGLLGDRIVYAIPATDMAGDLGNDRVTNIIMIGAYNAATRLVEFDDIEAGLALSLGAGKLDLLDLNVTALRAGRLWFDENAA